MEQARSSVDPETWTLILQVPAVPCTQRASAHTPCAAAETAPSRGAAASRVVPRLPLTRRAAQLSEMGFGEDFDRLQRVLEDNDKDVNRAVEALSASA
jgi:hypothetical protein